MKGLKKKIRDNKILRWGLIFSSIIAQGIRHADKTEKMYRIIFTIISSSIIYLLYPYDIAQFEKIIFSILIGHFINFLVNCNVFVIIIHFLMVVKLRKDRAFSYLYDMRDKLINQDWIEYSVVFGSISRGNIKPSSDIDISIVRKKGVINGFKSIYWSIIYKKIAELKAIPLELYISDSKENSIERYSYESIPVILTDPQSIVHNYYENVLSIEEAQKIN